MLTRAGSMWLRKNTMEGAVRRLWYLRSRRLLRLLCAV